MFTACQETKTLPQSKQEGVSADIPPHIFTQLYIAFQVSWPIVNDLCDYKVVILVLLAFDPKTPALVTYVQPHLGTDKCTSQK